MLTQQEKQDIDRVAKVGLRIIFGEAYSGFENTLSVAGMLRPTMQLSKMTSRFAVRSSKHPKFCHWFQPATAKSVNTRSRQNPQVFASVPCRTDRYKRSPIPHLTELLNAKSQS